MLRALHAGTKILQYKVLRVLGEGGFSINYLARDEDLDRLVVIKELFPDQFAARVGLIVEPRASRDNDFELAKGQFMQEARALARFEAVLQIFEANNTAYLVQYYRPGRDLADWLKEISGPPTQIELDSLLGALLDELELLHRRGLLHREISPRSIHICDDGRPVLIGFVVARGERPDRMKRLPHIVNAGYSALELYSLGGDGQGPWSDIYSLAATLYHAIGGAAPEEAAERILADNLAPARDVARLAYRASFLDAIDWALRLRPKERPQTVAEWRSRLLV